LIARVSLNDDQSDCGTDVYTDARYVSSTVRFCANATLSSAANESSDATVLT
jgi:hypothetical protein